MNALRGTQVLLRLSARHDRVVTACWSLFLVLLSWTSAHATLALYGTAQLRADAEQAIASTSAVAALYGPVSQSPTVGEIAVLKPFMIGSVIAAAITISIVVRHTRGQEDCGGADLVRAAGAGRLAPLASAYLAATAAATVLAVAGSAALMAAGLPLRGSVYTGMAWFLIGAAFAVIAAGSAQLAGTASLARGIALSALGASYLLRMIADTSPGLRWLAWCTPLGIVEHVHPFVQNSAAPLAILLVATLAVAGVLPAMVYRRDIGAAIWTLNRHSRRTRVHSRTGLAWRRVRRGWLFWAGGIAAMSAVVGNVAAHASAIFDNQALARYFESAGRTTDVIDALYSAELTYLGAAAAAFAVYCVATLSADEAAGRLTIAMAAAPSRWRWLVSYGAVAVLGSAALMVLGGLILAVGDLGDTHSWAHARNLVVAAAGQLPAAIAIAAIAAVAYAIACRVTPVSWAVVVAALATTTLGPLFQMPPGLVALSPFSHTATLTDTHAAAATVMIVGALALTTIAAVRFRRRDVG